MIHHCTIMNNTCTHIYRLLKLNPLKTKNHIILKESFGKWAMKTFKAMERNSLSGSVLF